MHAEADDHTARWHRRILTPEGVPVGVVLAEPSTRAAALLLDLVFMATGLGAMVLLIAIAGGGATSGALGVLFYGVVRMGYFAAFEAAWNGTTPGKRILGLRVVNRHGGRLRFEQVLARNLMREVEVFIPLGVVLNLGLVASGPAWVDVALMLWAGAFLLVPWLNRDGMRAGDFFAGTWVVVPGKVALAAEVAPAGPAAGDSAFHFTAAQLSVYGEFELQALEDVLRGHGPAAATRDARTRRTVAGRIAAKIGLGRVLNEAEIQPFLEAYYAALRQKLESGMLHGRRIANKHEASDDS